MLPGSGSHAAAFQNVGSTSLHIAIVNRSSHSVSNKITACHDTYSLSEEESETGEIWGGRGHSQKSPLEIGI